jgi:hypothetical protein
MACYSSPSFHPQRRPSLTHNGDATADDSTSSKLSCMYVWRWRLFSKLGPTQFRFAACWAQHSIRCHRTTDLYEHILRDPSVQLIDSTAEMIHWIPCRLRGAPSRSSEARLCSLHSTKDFPFGTSYPDHLSPHITSEQYCRTTPASGPILPRDMVLARAPD